MYIALCFLNKWVCKIEKSVFPLNNGARIPGMLIAFGISWPFNIVKSWKSRTAKGKSIAFEFIVVGGYLIGLLGKFISWKITGELAYSVWFYIADIIMVLTDVVLYYRNRKLDKQSET